jgi:hypothetical protein
MVCSTLWHAMCNYCNRVPPRLRPAGPYAGLKGGRVLERLVALSKGAGRLRLSAPAPATGLVPATHLSAGWGAARLGPFYLRRYTP